MDISYTATKAEQPHGGNYEKSLIHAVAHGNESVPSDGPNGLWTARPGAIGAAGALIARDAMGRGDGAETTLG